MDVETREKIFDPFFSTKGDHGTGLGLSQVYGFTQRSHGGINVESIEHQGTTFNLYFPREQAKSQAKLNPKVTPILQTHNLEYSILVVDDNLSLAELTSEILLSKGYKTEIAANAEEAIDKFKYRTFDVMITDIIMPGLNGYELSSIIKSSHPDVKIIVTSGYDDKVIPAPSNNNFYSFHLDKPVNRNTLLECIDKLLP